MSPSKFVSIAEAIREVGGKPNDLVEALREGVVRAQGRLMEEGDDRAGRPVEIPVTDWLDHVFDSTRFDLSGAVENLPGAYSQLKYVDIQIRRTDLKKLLLRRKADTKKKKPPAKAGRRPHPAKASILAELDRLIREEGKPIFKNRSELSRDLVTWYEEAQGADTGPDPSKVMVWLREDREDGLWLVLIREK
jgi:hypothetical protein